MFRGERDASILGDRESDNLTAPHHGQGREATLELLLERQDDELLQQPGLVLHPHIRATLDDLALQHEAEEHDVGGLTRGRVLRAYGGAVADDLVREGLDRSAPSNEDARGRDLRDRDQGDDVPRESKQSTSVDAWVFP